MTNLEARTQDDVGDIATYMRDVGEAARAAARDVARAGTSVKDHALRTMASAIRLDEPALLSANAQDVARAEAAGHDPAFVDRLRSPARRCRRWPRASSRSPRCGPRRRDHRPALPADRHPGREDAGAARRGRHHLRVAPERDRRRRGPVPQVRQRHDPARRLGGAAQQPAIAACVRRGLREAGLPEEAVQVIATTDRAAVGHLIADEKHVDVIVPRGGKSLIERIAREAKVPVIKHLDGVCHVFVDASADLDMAIRIADNAKTQRYSPCNTMETLLVARATSPPRVLPPLAAIYATRASSCAATTARARIVPAMTRGHRGRLVHRVPRADPRRARGRLARRGDRAHRALRLAAHRRDRHGALTAMRCASCARSIRAR
jgi:glutamate-5-semialdehyde dehydrogenase